MGKQLWCMQQKTIMISVYALIQELSDNNIMIDETTLFYISYCKFFDYEQIDTDWIINFEWP